MKCKNCNKDTDNPKFCSSSCSATYNNKGIRRNGKKSSKCIVCGDKTGRHAKKFCSKKCQDKHQYNDFIEKWKAGDCVFSTTWIASAIRKYLLDKHNNSCSQCGWNKVNIYTGKVPLEIDHIDGDALNHSESNLRLLCPNCHSLTPTYKALNKKSSRSR